MLQTKQKIVRDYSMKPGTTRELNKIKQNYLQS
jgi:hypothetical protein